MSGILVPVDASHGANEAARFAARLASPLGTRLILLHVFDSPSAASLGLHRMSKEDIDKAMAAVSRGSFEAAQKALQDGPTVEVDTRTSFGDPATEIVAIAKQLGVELIVMGSRGQSPMRELLLGSVSDKVLRHAKCPVTVVR